MTQDGQKEMVGRRWSVVGSLDKGHLKPYQLRPCDERILFDRRLTKSSRPGWSAGHLAGNSRRVELSWVQSPSRKPYPSMTPRRPICILLLFLSVGTLFQLS